MIIEGPTQVAPDTTATFLELLARPGLPGDKSRALSELIRETLNARSVGWFPLEPANAGDSPKEDSDESESQLRDRVLQHARPLVERLDDASQTTLIGIPVAGHGALVVTLITGQASVSSFVAWLKLAAGYYGLAIEQSKQEQWRALALDTTQRLGLLEGLVKVPDGQEALDQYCQQIARAAGANLALLYLAPRRRPERTLVRVAGSEKLGDRGETDRLARRLAQELRQSGSQQGLEFDSQAACPSRQAERLAAHLGVERVIVIPLVAPAGSVPGEGDAVAGGVRGAVVIAGNELEPQSLETVRRAVIQSSGGVLLRHAAGRMKGPTLPGRRARLGWLVAGGLLLTSLWLPFPYHVQSDITMEPTKRRFIAAPFDGVLVRALVQSGEVVTPGQALARMDEQPLRLERARQRAEQIRVQKSFESALAAGQADQALMAEIRLQELEASLHLIEERIEQASLVTPIGGVVLSPDLDDVEDSPVSLGQALFEVAELDRLRARIAVPAHQAAEIEVGQKVQLWVDNGEGIRRTGEIVRVAPRTEVQEGQNVLLCEVIVLNPDGAIRPGMGGHSAIEVGGRRLGWLLFHRLWDRVRVIAGM